jgi:GDP-D-mannose 3', 5'-epimerase
VNGINLLMQSDLEGAVNIGSSEYVSVDELVHTVSEAAGKEIFINHVDGPTGVQSRNFSLERIQSLGWEHKYSLLEGIRNTYSWVENQVKAK